MESPEGFRAMSNRDEFSIDVPRLKPWRFPSAAGVVIYGVKKYSGVVAALNEI